MEFRNLTKAQQERVIGQILSAYPRMNKVEFEQLIGITTVKGCSFINIKGYSSQISGHTEIADCLVNVGVSYENMLSKDAITYENCNLDMIDIDNFNYNTINTANLTLEQFKIAVAESLPIALAELRAPKQSGERVDNNVSFNKVLSFNTNTNNLSIRGQRINKVVKEKGTFKVVKSAPKTVAKKLIENFVNARTASLRTYNLPNVLGSININGNRIEIG